MPIVRVIKRENPYVQIDREAVNDKRISWKAKGVLLYLISKPADWTVQVSDLIKRAHDGRDAVYSALNELIAAGYVEREQERDDFGRVGDVAYVVSEFPSHHNDIPREDKRRKKAASGLSVNGENPRETPLPDYPYTENPDTDNPYRENTDISNKEFSNKDLKEKEEYTPPLVEQDLSGLREAFPDYARVTFEIETEVRERLRPVFPEESEFLAQAASLPLHPDTTYEIYSGIRRELNRTNRLDVSTFTLLHTVFRKFRTRLETGNLSYGNHAQWFLTTWNNERRTLEQKEMIDEKRQESL